MTLSKEQLLVCPLCKGPLEKKNNKHRLVCTQDNLSYPIKDGIPILIPKEAMPFEDQ